ncbi:MAG TPA: Hsp20/alpha crystallin family protein [Gaiellaceae bacterium]|jgi:HSP20 family protein
MEVVRWTPFRELEAMNLRMRRLFDEAGLVPALLPAADVYETEDEYVVELEVPGFEEKELEIEVTDHTVCVTGRREEEKEKKEKTYRLHERLEKSFERRFQLPAEADTKAVMADFEKGVLEIHAPKLQATKPRRIALGKKA